VKVDGQVFDGLVGVDYAIGRDGTIVTVQSPADGAIYRYITNGPDAAHKPATAPLPAWALPVENLSGSQLDSWGGRMLGIERFPDESDRFYRKRLIRVIERDFL
jgi:hypothetical protein